jgi:hypothetical protein
MPTRPSGSVCLPGHSPSTPHRSAPPCPAATSEPNDLAQPRRRHAIRAGSAIASLALTTLLAGLAMPAVAQTASALPGEFAFRTTKGFYLTAIDGGGRSAAPTIVTAATSAGAWERFRIVVGDPAPLYDKNFQTATGNYVTAVNTGGMTSDALHTDATQARSWEQFRMVDLSEAGFAPTWYGLTTIGGKSVTAVGGGGQYQDAIHTDGTQIGTWEEFRPVKCGDLGSGYDYYIIAADGRALTAANGGGAVSDALVSGKWFGEPDNLEWSRFTLSRQPDGSYALRTSNGANYLTALGGGGQVQEYIHCHPGFPGACIDGLSDIFHADATQVQGWEKFRIVDQGNCKYTVQTVSGFYFGLYQTSNGMMFTTRRSIISDNEKFEFVMSSLGSPPILH